MLALALIMLQQTADAPPVIERVTVPSAQTRPAVETLPRGPVPKASPASWIRSDDYPALAMKNGESGTTSFRLSVDAKGAATDCVVTATSGSASLDRTTCDLIRARASFSPALDSAGKPVAGSYADRVRWTIPAPRPVPQPGEFIFHFVVEADGRQSDCHVEKATGVMADRQAMVGCPAARFREPYKDEQGNPVRRRVTVMQSVIVEPAPETPSSGH